MGVKKKFRLYVRNAQKGYNAALSRKQRKFINRSAKVAGNIGIAASASIANKFIPGSGIVVGMAGKHMMNKIERKLSKPARFRKRLKSV